MSYLPRVTSQKEVESPEPPFCHFLVRFEFVYCHLKACLTNTFRTYVRLRSPYAPRSPSKGRLFLWGSHPSGVSLKGLAALRQRRDPPMLHTSPPCKAVFCCLETIAGEGFALNSIANDGMIIMSFCVSTISKRSRL